PLPVPRSVHRRCRRPYPGHRPRLRTADRAGHRRGAGGRRMSTVIIIASRKPLLHAAVDLGLTPVLVRGHGRLDWETIRLTREVACTDLFDEDGVVEEVERLHRQHNAVRVVSLSEDGLIPAARVNQR